MNQKLSILRLLELHLLQVMTFVLLIFYQEHQNDNKVVNYGRMSWQYAETAPANPGLLAQPQPSLSATCILCRNYKNDSFMTFLLHCCIQIEPNEQYRI